MTLRFGFYTDAGQTVVGHLRTNQEWTLSRHEDGVIAERSNGERYLVPWMNIAGMSIPREAPADPAQHPEAARDESGDPDVETSATKQLAVEASARARGRSGRK